jgi:membrane-bound lytic murein transglycosylase B
VRFPVQPPSDAVDRAVLLAPDILPSFSAAEMQARGAILPPEAAEVDSALALVELENGGAAPSYVAGTSNFYAVTRYNWSSYYALAVVELGEAVRAARGRPS